MSSAFTATQLLLAALRLDQTPQAWWMALEQAQVNWDDLAVSAIVLGLAPQLHHRLTAWGVDLPPQVAAKLSVTYEAHARRNAAIYEQLDEILAACYAKGLRPIALKGVHLAACVYEHPALRPMNDIDLLFSEAELPAAHVVLHSLGYRARHKRSELGAGVTKHTSTFRRESGESGATPNPYLSTGGDRTVEPHTSLEESWHGLKVDITPGVRERAVPVQLGTQMAHVLATEDLLLHLCVHFSFHLIMGAPALVQLADLGVVCRDKRLDWAGFLERAQRCSGSPYALAALSLAQKLSAAPVPDEVLNSLSEDTPRRLRGRIRALNLQTIMERTQQKPWKNTWQRLLHGVRARAETACWAPTWQMQWRVWLTALQIGKSDTGRELLQSIRRRRMANGT